jgi:hypothetical protein
MAQYQDPGGRHKHLVVNFEDCEREALLLLIKAADEWAEGNPEQPPTKEVLDNVLHVFAKRGFLRRPYGA